MRTSPNAQRQNVKEPWQPFVAGLRRFIAQRVPASDADDVLQDTLLRPRISGSSTSESRPRRRKNSKALRGRIDRAGGTVTNEGETTCCYANSDKTWVVDQQGVSWEAFYTSGEADTYDGEATGATS